MATDILLNLEVNTAASAKNLLNVQKQLKAVTDLNKEQISLEKEQQKLQKTGETLGNVELKRLVELRKAEADRLTQGLDLKQQRTELTRVTNNQIKVDKSLQGSNEQLKAQLSLLTLEYNKLSEVGRENTVEGKKLGAEVEGLTAKLKENESAVGDNRRNVGNYKESIIEAFRALEDENKEIADNIVALKEQQKEVADSSDEFAFFSTELSKLEGDLEKNNEALGKSSTEVGGFGKALEGTKFEGFISGIKATGKAFLANPIGLIVVGIVGALALLKEAFTSTEDGQAEFDKGLNVLSALFNLLLKAIRPVAVFLIDNLVDGFKAAAKGVAALSSAIATGLEFIGADDAAASIRNTTSAVEGQVKASIALSNATLEVNKLKREQQKIQLTAQLEQEQLRIARDSAEAQGDINKARQLNNELGERFEEQLVTELEIANKSLFIAQEQVRINGANTENLELQAQAEFEIVDINERILGQKAEQQTFNDGLTRTAIADAKKISDTNAAATKKDKDAKIAADKEIADKKAVSDKEQADRELSAQEELSNLKIQGVENDVQREKDIITKAFDDKIAALTTNSEVEIELAKQLRTNLNSSLDELDIQHRLAKDEEDFENFVQLSQIRGENEFEIRQIRLDRQREQELLNAEQTGADLDIINTKFNDLDKELKQDNAEHKIGLASDAFGSLSEIVGKETELGKGLAIAQTGIDTFVGAQKAFNSLSAIPIVGPALGAVAAAAAIAGGIARVSKIKSTPIPKKEKGGMLQGPSHADGGIPISVGGSMVEAEGGEAIINKRSTKMFAPLLSQINSFKGFGKKFQDGGVISPAISAPLAPGVGSITNIFNTDELAASIGNAVAENTQVVLPVESLNETQNNINVIENSVTF